jgi:hypothetical protein
MPIDRARHERETAMREVNGQDLLGGSDHEFVVNLYTVILNRWPDEEGYRHHFEKVENRPETRRQLIEDVAGSPEGRNLGVVLHWPGATVAAAPPAPAGGAGDLAATLAALRDSAAAMDAATLAEAQRLLAETLAALAAHQARALEARLAALEGRLGWTARGGDAGTVP